jgi:hypothetical protein
MARKRAICRALDDLEFSSARVVLSRHVPFPVAAIVPVPVVTAFVPHTGHGGDEQAWRTATPARRLE